MTISCTAQASCPSRCGSDSPNRCQPQGSRYRTCRSSRFPSTRSTRLSRPRTRATGFCGRRTRRVANTARTTCATSTGGPPCPQGVRTHQPRDRYAAQRRQRLSGRDGRRVALGPRRERHRQNSTFAGHEGSASGRASQSRWAQSSMSTLPSARPRAEQRRVAPLRLAAAERRIAPIRSSRASRRGSDPSNGVRDR
jgi:hypothetical protein